MTELVTLELQVPDACPECGCTALIRDPDAGEVVCQGCGLVVDTILDHGPEWRIYEPDHMQTHPRASPTPVPALSGDDYTLLPQFWTHPNPETQATMHRLRKQQAKDRSPRARNFHQAKNMLFTLGDQANVPLNLLNQAADIYRQAYAKGLVRGRSIHAVMAASIYAAYRLQGVPRTIRELAEAMDVEFKDLTRVYRLLLTELRLSPENPQAEAHVPRLAEALGLTGEETQIALNILREARRLKHTLGRGPRGLAAAAVYIAQRSRPRSQRISQDRIAQAAGITSVTIRNRYQDLMEAAAV